jgi:hypothetical protein
LHDEAESKFRADTRLPKGGEEIFSIEIRRRRRLEAAADANTMKVFEFLFQQQQQLVES